MLATAIKNSIQEARENGIENGIKKGITKGKLESKLEIVKKMLSRNYPLEEIADLTGLPLEEIKKNTLKAE
ncbi:MAG: hypothetical protein ABRQ37_06900 [Candidatus Eremiobacterota bacterium]